VILAKSDEWKPDLIVVGTHSHGALSRFFLGSAAQSLVHNALCSVRVARASENRPSSNGQKTAVRLLVGVDGSDGADAAVDSIISRNWAAGTEVRVVSAMSYLVWSSAKQFDLVEPSKMQETEFYRREEARAKEIAERAVAKLEQAGFSVSSFVKSEDPRKLLIEQAEEWQADCIFVGAQGLSRIERILIGSVSSAVAARARCSVEVVRGES
jgi:nucleotide-binding universal stress UspA family protein